jgi:hypothetical protein
MSLERTYRYLALYLDTYKSKYLKAVLDAAAILVPKAPPGSEAARIAEELRQRLMPQFERLRQGRALVEACRQQGRLISEKELEQVLPLPGGFEMMMLTQLARAVGEAEQAQSLLASLSAAKAELEVFKDTFTKGLIGERRARSPGKDTAAFWCNLRKTVRVGGLIGGNAADVTIAVRLNEDTTRALETLLLETLSNAPLAVLIPSAKRELLLDDIAKMGIGRWMGAQLLAVIESVLRDSPFLFVVPRIRVAVRLLDVLPEAPTALATAAHITVARDWAIRVKANHADSWKQHLLALAGGKPLNETELYKTFAHEFAHEFDWRRSLAPGRTASGEPRDWKARLCQDAKADASIRDVDALAEEFWRIRIEGYAKLVEAVRSAERIGRLIRVRPGSVLVGDALKAKRKAQDIGSLPRMTFLGSAGFKALVDAAVDDAAFAYDYGLRTALIVFFYLLGPDNYRIARFSRRLGDIVTFRLEGDPERLFTLPRQKLNEVSIALELLQPKEIDAWLAKSSDAAIIIRPSADEKGKVENVLRMMAQLPPGKFLDFYAKACARFGLETEFRYRNVLAAAETAALQAADAVVRETLA